MNKCVTHIYSFFLVVLISESLYAQDIKSYGDNSTIIKNVYGDVIINYPDIPEELIKSIIDKVINQKEQQYVNQINSLTNKIDQQNVIIQNQNKDIEIIRKQVEQLANLYEDSKKEWSKRSENDISRDFQILIEKGRLDEAEILIENYALNLENESAKTNFDVAVIKTLNLKYQEATKWYAAAAELPPKNFKYINAYGLHLQNIGMYSLAIEQFKQALNLELKTSSDSSKIYNNLGLALHSIGEYDQAMGFYNKALALDTVIFGNKHAKIALRYNNIGGICESKGDYNEAISYYEKALEINFLSYGINNRMSGFQYSNIGLIWNLKRKPDEAISYFNKALIIFSKFYGDNHPYVALEFNNLGAAWLLKGDFETAIPLIEKAISINNGAYGKMHPSLASNYDNLGKALYQKKNFDQAIKYFQTAIEIYSFIYGSQHQSLSITYCNLASVMLDKGESQEAIQLLNKVLSIDSLTIGLDHPSVAMPYYNLGIALFNIKSYDRAIECFQKSIIILQKYPIENQDRIKSTNTKIAESNNEIGMSYYQRKFMLSALFHFEESIISAQSGNRDDILVISYLNTCQVLRHFNRHDEALEAITKGIIVAEKLYHKFDLEYKMIPDSLKNNSRNEYNRRSSINMINSLYMIQVCCYLELNKSNEANERLKYLNRYAVENKDDELLKKLEQGCSY